MAVYKIFPSADATLYSAFPYKNTGRDPVLEVSVKNSYDYNRYQSRGLVDQSPYYSYDVAVDDNYSIPTFTPYNPDVRRALLQFSDADIATLRNFSTQAVSGSWQANLKLNLAFAQNLNTTYSLEVYSVSQSWAMGTGKYASLPEARNGVSWTFTSISGSAKWDNDPLYWSNIELSTWDSFTWWQWQDDYPATTGTAPGFITGGGSWNSTPGTQYFDYMSNKDIDMDITPIVNGWFSGSLSNYGLLLKHPQIIENSSASFVDLKFFSVDTHTIYPPCIELRWDDSNYYPVGTGYVLDDQFVCNLANNPGTFKRGSVYKFRTSVRDTYPARQFTTSSVYLNAKYLSEQTYWALQDLKTNEMIIDFDDNYTKVSADNTSNYFYIYMNGLEPERFYKILLKTKIYSTTYGPLSVYDNEQSIYDALSLYGPDDLALLPTETVMIDNNLVFKVIQ